MGDQTRTAENAKHLLECRHCIGKNCKTYFMPCHITKVLDDDRLRILVFGERDWRDTYHVSRTRYVDASRVFLRPQPKRCSGQCHAAVL